ncbi:MAG: hypothetical protein V3S29_11040 [bacterium]
MFSASVAGRMPRQGVALLSWCAVALSVALTMALAAPLAQAQFLGPSVAGLEAGNWAAGVAQANLNRRVISGGAAATDSDFAHETAFVDYGLGQKRVLRGELGTVKIGGSRGTEIAVGYRAPLAGKRRVGKNGRKLELGYSASIRRAALTGGGSVQVDVAAGGKVKLSDATGGYLGGLVSWIGGADGSDLQADSLLGIYGGFVFEVESTLQVGAEIHMLNATGLTLFVRLTL